MCLTCQEMDTRRTFTFLKEPAHSQPANEVHGENQPAAGSTPELVGWP